MDMIGKVRRMHFRQKKSVREISLVQSGVHQIVVGTKVGSEHGKVSSRKGRPNYPMEFKRRLAAASCEGKMSASRVAREHGVNDNLLFKWRRQYCAGELRELGGSVDDRCVLLSVALAAPEGSPPMLCATRASCVDGVLR